MKPDAVELYSPFSPEECRRRLEETATQTLQPFDLGTHVHAKVLARKDVELWSARAPRPLRDLYLRVRFEPHGQGSLILGEFGFTNRVTALGLAVGAFFVAALTLCLAIVFPRSVPYSFIIALFIVITLLRVIFFNPRWAGRRDRFYILEFLCRTLHAIPAADAPEPLATRTTIKR